jgi:hypothetical protein
MMGKENASLHVIDADSEFQQQIHTSRANFVARFRNRFQKEIHN